MMKLDRVIDEQDSVVVEIQIAAPANRVFEALISESQLMRWFTDLSHETELWQMDARAGGQWRFVTKAAKIAVNGVTRFEGHGEILEFDRPRLLVYTWFANWHNNPESPTVVRWELTSSGSGTNLKVIHSGLREESAMRRDYGSGWVGVLANLKKFVEA
jgi:uncharacterized protein YndB with AHSA1/START domain